MVYPRDIPDGLPEASLRAAITIPRNMLRDSLLHISSFRAVDLHDEQHCFHVS